MASSADIDEFEVETLLSVPHVIKQEDERPRFKKLKPFRKAVYFAIGILGILLPLVYTKKIKFRTKTLFNFVNNYKSKQFISRFSSEIAQEYIRWHNQTIRDFKNGKVNRTEIKWLIWQGNHGIGDRFRGLLSVFVVAMITNRVLLVQWEKSMPMYEILQISYGTNFYYNETEYFGKINFLTAPRSKSSPLENLDYFLANDSIIISSTTFKPRMRLFLKNLNARPYLLFSKRYSSILKLGERVDDFSFYSMILKNFIQVMPGFERLIQNIKKEGLTNYRTDGPTQLEDRYISIHIRYGKGVNEDSAKRFNFTSKGFDEHSVSECIAKQAVKMARKLGLKPGTYFLATDTPELRDILGSKIRRLDKSSNLFFAPWGVKHTGSMSLNSEDMKTLVYTFVELFLLSRGRGLVHLYSGFANLAKYLGNIKKAKEISLLNTCLQT